MTAPHSSRAGPALRALAEADPALAALSLWCRHRDGPGPVVRTSDTTIEYGPAFSALSPAEQIGLAAHHILHVAFRHPARAAGLGARLGPGFDARLFNICADAIVNETVLAAGYVLPRPRLGLSDLLGAVFRTPQAQADLSAWDVERLYLRLSGAEASGGGRASDAAKARAEEVGFEDDLRPGGPDGDEADDPAEWQGRLARALAEGRSAGRGLGRLTGRLGDLPRTETPWEVLLRGAIARALAGDRQVEPLRPARRWLAMDAAARASGAPAPAFQPAANRPRATARFAVLLDTSGSVPRHLRERFAGEVAGIAARTGAEVHLVVFDAEVRAARDLPRHDLARGLAAIDWPEGGGTAFAPALAAACAATPSMIVVLTDLEAPVGAPPGRVPVVWAVPAAPREPPPYGRVIALDR